jgi:nicotinamidase-related amidase
MDNISKNDMIVSDGSGPQAVRLAQLDAEKTVLVIVDMVRGFALSGALASPLVAAVIPENVRLAKLCAARGIARVALMDCHTASSRELCSYPPHCMAGTDETQLVPGLQGLGIEEITKNSTNGFFAPGFGAFLAAHPQADTFIITGDCTDICVMQLALTLRAYYDQNDRASRIIIPLGAVATYDAPGHSARACAKAALDNMKLNGIELAGRID